MSRLTQFQYAELLAYIREHAIDGKIALRRKDLAAKATEALGFTVSPPKAASTAVEAGVLLLVNRPRTYAKKAKAVEKSNLEVLVHKLDRIERKLTMIMDELGVKCP